MTKNQRRRSFSIQKDYNVTVLNSIINNEDDTITVLGPIDIHENIYPLTEENLAIHTNNVSKSFQIMTYAYVIFKKVPTF